MVLRFYGTQLKKIENPNTACKFNVRAKLLSDSLYNDVI